MGRVRIVLVVTMFHWKDWTIPCRLLAGQGHRCPEGYPELIISSTSTMRTRPSALVPALGYLPNQQQFRSLNFPQSLFLNQNYITAGFRSPFSPSVIRSQEFRLRLFPTSKSQRRTRPRWWVRVKPGLQL